jgi:hypothetical protein
VGTARAMRAAVDHAARIGARRTARGRSAPRIADTAGAGKASAPRDPKEIDA